MVFEFMKVSPLSPVFSNTIASIILSFLFMRFNITLLALKEFHYICLKRLHKRIRI